MRNTFLRLTLTFVRNVSRIITVTFSFEWLLNSRLQRNNLLLHIERPRSTIRVVRESISIKGSAVDLEKKESAPVRAVITNTIFIWKKKRIISIDSSNENGDRHELKDLLKDSDVTIEDIGFFEQISLRSGIWLLAIQIKSATGHWLSGKHIILVVYPTKFWIPRKPRNYSLWIRRERKGITEDVKEEMKRHVSSMALKPIFSIILDLKRGTRNFKKTLKSLREQTYPHFEICILRDEQSTASTISDNSTDIRFLNDGLSDIRGDYCIFIDAGDRLHRYALYEFASSINHEPKADVLYGDEDTLDTAGNHSNPFHKPDWSPDYLEVFNYLEFPSCYKSKLAIAGYKNHCLYDLALRSTEAGQRIIHIPKVLGHRDTKARVDGGNSDRNTTYSKSLQSRLLRTGRLGKVSEHPLYAGSFTYTPCLRKNPKISIVIPTAGNTRNINERNVDLLPNLITQIYERSTYKNIDCVVVDNGTLSESQSDVLKKFGCRTTSFQEKKPNIARKINQGASQSNGEYLLILNDDIEILTPDWLERMVRHFEKTGVGIVGCRLLYPEGTIQHAGIVYVNGHPEHVSRRKNGDESGYFYSTASVRNYLAVTGACMMTPRDIFFKTGGYNENFPINYNDIEYCLKLRQIGYRVVYDGTCCLAHLESASRAAGIKRSEEIEYQQNISGLLSTDPYYNNDVFNLKKPAFQFEINPR